MINYSKNIILAIFSLLFLAASPAQAAGILEFFIPALREAEEDPRVTLKAPFYDGDTENEAVEKAVNFSAVPLDQPHVLDKEISEWLMQSVSEIMTFEQDDYQKDIAETEGYFNESGEQLFTAFLQQQNIQNVLESRRYFVRAFVQSTPKLLNEGAIDGVYRWLYEVPVMVTFMPRGMRDYKKQDAINQNMVFTIQVVRDLQKDGLGIAIERWDGKRVKNSP